MLKRCTEIDIENRKAIGCDSYARRAADEVLRRADIQEQQQLIILASGRIACCHDLMHEQLQQGG